MLVNKNYGRIILTEDGGKMEDNTILFNTNEITNTVIKSTLKDVYDALEERGYNPINQIVGYIISGDLGYISSYKEARNKISKIDRTVIVEELLKGYLK